MNTNHKILREILRGMIKPAAEQILQTQLPAREYQAIYYVDIEKESVGEVAQNRLHCDERTVKRYRENGYEKLAAFHFYKP